MSDHLPKLTIKQWAEDDRPREKLLLKGKHALSDAELLALLIGSGNKEETAVELARRVLQHHHNNLNKLARLTVAELMQFKGIGEAKAIAIVAALELGSRRELTQASEQEKITSSHDCYQLFKPILASLPHEEFWVLYLNRANKIIEKCPISKGGITGTVADIRLIFKRALENYATSLILAHNHPSGNLTPSQEDIKLTHKIQDAGRMLDILLIDHIIVSENGYHSFADAGML